MNNQILILCSLLCAALIASTGCSKQEGSAAGPAEKAVATAEARTEVVKQRAQTTATNGQAQALLEQATKLVAEKKWPEALALLKQVTGQPLPPEFQSMVQSLKEQAQKGVESMASAQNAGGLLPK
jgi:outer membrane PBP1 activator LpoA protein